MKQHNRILPSADRAIPRTPQNNTLKIVNLSLLTITAISQPKNQCLEVFSYGKPTTAV